MNQIRHFNERVAIFILLQIELGLTQTQRINDGSPQLDAIKNNANSPNNNTTATAAAP